MKILLIGANGQVGDELLRALAPLGEVVATTRSGRLDDGRACLTADLSDPASLPALVAGVGPDLVVNAGAYTAVDQAEQDSVLAFRVNAEAPGAIAGACAAAGIPFVHYSTDYVFAGDATAPYREDDATAPLGVYGASKLAGEIAVRDSGAAHKIFRLCWVYGPRGRNFLRTMLRLAGERDVLRVVADQVGSPTPAAWIADATAAAIRARPELSGTWHLAASGQTSWHGFASAIVDEAAAAGRIVRAPRVEAISSSEFPTPARRPGYSVLDTSALAADFGLRLPDWREGVAPVLTAAA
jgi:dTDP-4-dehydrorhamnose reductase